MHLSIKQHHNFATYVTVMEIVKPSQLPEPSQIQNVVSPQSSFGTPSEESSFSDEGHNIVPVIKDSFEERHRKNKKTIVIGRGIYFGKL